ncbi:MAG: hypothetical protein HUJ63_10540, partial [Enterococcus sp.]|nr:hypothetical protein [Enterococcus sp.]
TVTKAVAARIRAVTGKWLEKCRDFLIEADGGCCHAVIGEDDDRMLYAVVVGWGQTGDGTEYTPTCKIGRQPSNSIMQCDFDIDFEMPWGGPCGDVDDTREEIGLKPMTAREWDRLAAEMRKQARRIWRTYAVKDDNY